MATKLANPQTDRPAMTGAGARFRVSKSATFEAAHFIGQKPEGHPYSHIHGHSFRIEATVAGTLSDESSWVEDFADITAAIEGVAARLDHRLLNEIDGLDTPTLERICLWVAGALKPALPGLVAVELARPSLGERVALEIA